MNPHDLATLVVADDPWDFRVEWCRDCGVVRLTKADGTCEWYEPGNKTHLRDRTDIVDPNHPQPLSQAPECRGVT